MIPIKHLLHINSPKEKVFKALSDEKSMSKWYTTVVNGEFKMGAVITFEFVNLASFKFKIISFQENEHIHFECIESEWDNIGHVMKYDLDENGEKTRIRYTYEGFTEMDDSYSNMNYSSGKYLESLRQYCQNGKGEAFGSLNYRS
tara:strand:- start:529 stop:963 length:435 start_codon:yes stop_codon:yes gene_type:complete